MRAHYLQHVPFEGLGSIEAWLRESGYEIRCTRFFETTGLPDPDMVDLLIVLGGPMSANDEDVYPWLAPEQRFIRRCIDAGKPVLGICLGAQLIANALGAKVYPNRCKEIGWLPIQTTRLPADDTYFQFPPTVEVFHWHGETFDLPDGAVRLARSAACENQAIQFSRRTIGLQFHLETTPESAREIIAHCRAELRPAEYVQPENVIRAAPLEKYETINRLMADVLVSLTCVGKL